MDLPYLILQHRLVPWDLRGSRLLTRLFQAKCTYNPSALHAELLAIAAAVFVCPAHCVVQIYTDCANLIKCLGHDRASLFNTRQLFKTAHINLLTTILDYIQTYQLSVSWNY